MLRTIKRLFTTPTPPVVPRVSRPVVMQPQVIDCGYVIAVNQGFRGSSDHWKTVKEAYVDSLRDQALATNTVIDCNNILFDGQGMQDADGKWHR